MHIHVLASGSKGNSTLVRAGKRCLLIDAGLTAKELRARLEQAGLGPRGLDEILITHAHRDHSRSAGSLAKSHDAVVHCAVANMHNRSLSRAKRFQALGIGSPYCFEPEPGESRQEALTYTAVPLPHDCDPTVAFRIEHRGRVFAQVTDLGHAPERVMRSLQGAHVLLLEFNYDAQMLATGPYPPQLRRRVGGQTGHLSNDQAAALLAQLAGPQLHTLILGHLSAKNNTPALATQAAQTQLARLDRRDVQVIVAQQDQLLSNLQV